MHDAILQNLFDLNEGNKNPKRNSEVNICQVVDDEALHVTGVMMDILNFSTIFSWPFSQKKEDMAKPNPCYKTDSGHLSVTHSSINPTCL